MRNDSITAVEGVKVGHWADRDAVTGCTVVVLPEPNVVGAEARGGAPGTREYALLRHGMRVEMAQAILLTGGSAFGLAAADGVVRGLEEDGRGHETPVARVPIVPSAVIFDLFRGDCKVRPGPEHGYLAYRAATDDPVRSGLEGVGVGATVAKWRGFEHMVPGGIGSAVVEAGAGLAGVLVALNAVGDVFSLDGESLTGGDHASGPPALTQSPLTNTTLAVVATNIALTRAQLSRLSVRAHDAFGACLRPAHTPVDGDVVFSVSTLSTSGEAETVAEAVFAATAQAIEKAVRASSG